jgi:predicted nuclease of predicted toxin-antitoxin system
MRFLVDECVGNSVCNWLIEEGHNIVSVYEVYRGFIDEDIIKIANKENRIIITDDKDFGEIVFRNKIPHKGIILLRLSDRRSSVKIEILKRVLKYHSSKLNDNFIVITEKKIRITEK